jgi:MarR-like DNA-binding transcriptional regulator SgrR of sgrS sRNA
MIALLSLAIIAGAPRLPYGGEAGTIHAGGTIAIDPSAALDLSDLSVAAAIFESLYTFDAKGEVIPNLASSLPIERQDRLVIPLRSATLHDGRALRAEDVARVFARWSEPGAPGAHLVLPIAKARGIEVLPEENALSIRLASPYADWPRMLASTRASIALVARDRPLGTGPFRFLEGKAGEAKLVAFAENVRGRPYLDAIRFTAAGDPLGPRTRIGRSGLTIALELPEPQADPGAIALLASGSAAPRELVFLAIGASLAKERSVAILRAIDVAIGRDRLVRRYLGPSASAADTLSGLPAGSTIAVPQQPQRARATLLLPRRHGVDRRFAERVQLDLLRAGLSATIELVEDEVLDARRKSGDFELMIDRFLLEGEPKLDATHHLGSLLAFAAARGVISSVISSAELTRFSSASEEDKTRFIRELDQRIRDEAHVVAIAHRVPEAWIDRRLVGAHRAPSGAILLEDAFFTRSALE